MQHGMWLNGEEHDVGLSRTATGYLLHIGGTADDDAPRRSIPVNLIDGEEGDQVLTVNGAVDHISVAVDGDDIYVHLDGEHYHLKFEHALDRLAQLADGSDGDAIRAAMPGSLVSLAVAEGDSVQTGQTLLVMESMKMETTIVAPRDGNIAAVHVDIGQTFDKDAALVTLETDGDAE